MDILSRRIHNVLEYIEDAAIKFPVHTAFADDNICITYGELAEQVARIGYHINKQIKAIKQPIIVFMDKCVECLITFFGVVASGNFYVCIDTQMASERIRKILEHLQPVAVIKKRSTGKQQFSGYPILEYEELLYEDNNRNDMMNELKKIRNRIIDADPLYVLYTSGSTGIPKGSVISHRSVIDYVQWLCNTFQFNRKTIFGSQTPFYFSMSVLDIFSTISNAATLQIIPKKLFSFPIRLLEYLNDKHINTIYWVPSALCTVADWKALDYVKVPELQTILFAGEVMPTKQLNIWRSYMPDALYANLFGPTEITDIGLYYIIDREFRNDEVIPIGRPCSNMDAFALTREGKQINRGETGELYFRGSFVGCGYYNNMEKTKEAFVQNPLQTSYPEIVYRTGDLVRLNEYNEYIYMGRRDNQIKRFGYRIELGEIETIACALEKVERAVCIFNLEKEHIILLYQGKVDKNEILVYLKKYLPMYMIPDEIINIQSIPLNANGKVDRMLLQQTYLKEIK